MKEEVEEFCSICKRYVISSNFTCHTAFCQRNIGICDECGEPIRKDLFKEHEAKHHISVTCDLCGTSFRKWMLPKHREECPMRLISCEMCEKNFPFTTISIHIELCGSRTEKCSKCSKYIMMKDKKQHSELHANEKQIHSENSVGNKNLNALHQLADQLAGRTTKKSLTSELLQTRPGPSKIAKGNDAPSTKAPPCNAYLPYPIWTPRQYEYPTFNSTVTRDSNLASRSTSGRQKRTFSRPMSSTNEYQTFNSAAADWLLKYDNNLASQSTPGRASSTFSSTMGSINENPTFNSAVSRGSNLPSQGSPGRAKSTFSSSMGYTSEYPIYNSAVSHSSNMAYQSTPGRANSTFSGEYPIYNSAVAHGSNLASQSTPGRANSTFSDARGNQCSDIKEMISMYLPDRAFKDNWLETRGETPNTCPICNQDFFSNDISEHVKYCIERHFQCPKCYKNILHQNRDIHLSSNCKIVEEQIPSYTSPLYNETYEETSILPPVLVHRHSDYPSGHPILSPAAYTSVLDTTMPHDVSFSPHTPPRNSFSPHTPPRNSFSPRTPPRNSFSPHTPSPSNSFSLLFSSSSSASSEIIMSSYSTSTNSSPSSSFGSSDTHSPSYTPPETPPPRDDSHQGYESDHQSLSPARPSADDNSIFNSGVSRSSNLASRSTSGTENTAMSSTMGSRNNNSEAKGSLDNGALWNYQMELPKCIICFTNERNIVILPCGHLVFCSTCADLPNMKNHCPICRKRIEKKVKTYVS